MQLENFIEKF